MTKQTCTVCGADSIPGLIRGCGKCQYHYDVGQFGKEWADKCRPPLYNFYARIWEKAEHWYFDVELTAPDRSKAWAQLTKDYPKKDYRIAELSQHGEAITTKEN